MPDRPRAAPLPATFQIGAVTVEAARNRLLGPDGAVVVLEPKVMSVLCRLAAQPGDVVSRDDLISAVWGVEHGADESLTRAISILRKGLGDGGRIETIPKRGYRLELPTDQLPDRTPGGPPVLPPSGPLAQPWLPERWRRRWPVAAALLAGLVVAGAGTAGWLVMRERARLSAPGAGITLQVEAFSGASGAEGLAHALSDDLTGRVSSYSLYKVRSGPARMPHPGSGDLAYVLKGAVETRGQDSHVSVQLVDAASGDHLWAQAYDRPTASAEDDLATIIASEVQSPLLVAAKAKLRARPILSLRPWELNLLVTWVPGGEGAPPGPPGEASFWLQKRALAIDPDYAPAHATFAEMLAYHALFDPPSDTAAALARAQGHADRALQLAPYDAEVLYHVATYYRFVGDRDRARALLQRVLALQPSYLTAQADLYFVEGQCQSDSEAAIAALNRLGGQMSPANPARWLVLSHLADLELGAGRPEAARALAGQSRDIVATIWSSVTLAAAKAQLGDRNDLTRVAHEHAAQWTHLDYDDFAERAAARWCLNGPATTTAQRAFHSLARAVS